MKKILKLFLISSATLGITLGTTQFVLSCGELPADKTDISDADVNTQLAKIKSLNFSGIDKSGTFSAPTEYVLANTKLVYAVVSDGSTPPNSAYSPDIPKTLTINSVVWISAVVTDSDQYQIAGTIIPVKFSVTGLDQSISANDVNAALQAITITYSNGTGSYSGAGTFTITVNTPVINNIKYQFASSRGGAAPAYTDNIPTDLANGDQIYINAIPSPHYVFDAPIQPKIVTVPANTFAQQIPAADINTKLQTAATAIAGTISGTIGSGTFTDPSWDVDGTQLVYALGPDGTTPPPSFSHTHPSGMGSQNNTYLWVSAEVLSGYTINGNLVPQPISLSGKLKISVSVDDINTSLRSIPSLTFPANSYNGNNALAAPVPATALPTGTRLVYAKGATGANVPDISTFTTTVPTNLSNTDQLFISAVLTDTNTYSLSGVPTVITKVISGLNNQLTVTNVNSWLSGITTPSFATGSTDGSGTFTAVDWSAHSSQTQLYYKVLAGTTPPTPSQFTSTTPPTDLSSGDKVWITAKALEGNTITDASNAPADPTPYSFTVPTLVHIINIQTVNDALAALNLSLNTSYTNNGSGQLNTLTWNVANTYLVYFVNQSDVAPIYNNVSWYTASPTTLNNDDRVWVSAKVSDPDSYKLSADPTAVDFHVLPGKLKVSVDADNVNASLNDVVAPKTGIQITGTEGSGTFADVVWSDYFIDNTDADANATHLVYAVGKNGAAAPALTDFHPISGAGAVPINTLSNHDILYVTAVLNDDTKNYISGTIKIVQLEITGLKTAVDAHLVDAELNKVTPTYTYDPTSGTYSVDLISWGTGATANTQLKFALTNDATAPTADAYNTTKPASVSNNQYLWITYELINSTTSTFINGTPSVRSIKITGLVKHLTSTSIQTVLDALTPVFTGNSGNAALTAFTWNDAAVAGTKLQYAMITGTTIGTYQDTPPNAGTLSNSDAGIQVKVIPTDANTVIDGGVPTRKITIAGLQPGTPQQQAIDAAALFVATCNTTPLNITLDNAGPGKEGDTLSSLASMISLKAGNWLFANKSTFPGLYTSANFVTGGTSDKPSGIFQEYDDVIVDDISSSSVPTTEGSATIGLTFKFKTTAKADLNKTTTLNLKVTVDAILTDSIQSDNNIFKMMMNLWVSMSQITVPGAGMTLTEWLNPHTGHFLNDLVYVYGIAKPTSKTPWLSNAAGTSDGTFYSKIFPNAAPLAITNNAPFFTIEDQGVAGIASDNRNIPPLSHGQISPFKFNSKWFYIPVEFKNGDIYSVTFNIRIT